MLYSWRMLSSCWTTPSVSPATRVTRSFASARLKTLGLLSLIFPIPSLESLQGFKNRNIANLRHPFKEGYHLSDCVGVYQKASESDREFRSRRRAVLARLVLTQIPAHVRFSQPDHLLGIPDFRQCALLHVSDRLFGVDIAAWKNSAIVVDVHGAAPQQIAGMPHGRPLGVIAGNGAACIVNLVLLDPDLIDAVDAPHPDQFRNLVTVFLQPHHLNDAEDLRLHFLLDSQESQNVAAHFFEVRPFAVFLVRGFGGAVKSKDDVVQTGFNELSAGLIRQRGRVGRDTAGHAHLPAVCDHVEDLWIQQRLADTVRNGELQEILSLINNFLEERKLHIARRKMNVLARAHGAEEVAFCGALNCQRQGSPGNPRPPPDIAGEQTQSIVQLQGE